MKKILRFFVVTKDILLNNQDGLLVKINFLYSITSHYLLKIFGINYCSFPEMNIKVDNCYFRTKKNTIDFWMVWKGYEKEIFNQLYKQVKEKDTFIDVGANIGRYSVVLSKKGLNVYSFEPIKSNFDLLNRNLELNNLKKNIKTYNLGLGDEKKEVEISYLPHKQGEGSLVFNVKGRKEKIKLDLLDNLDIKPQNRCFLKIDVEAYEYEVLRGAENFIKKNKPFIIIEIWNKNTTKLLNGMGYYKKREIWFQKDKK